MNWAEALWWLPTAAVAAMTALALLAAAATPARPGKKYWVVAVLLLGALATGGTAWQQERSHRALTGETARLRELAARLDEVAGLLAPAPGTAAERGFGTVTAGIVALKNKIEDLQDQIRALKEKARGRIIDPDTAAKIAEYLRPQGAHRVVVSCAPDDLEAYTYANQIANVLRAAGWEAPGLETTTIFGEAPAINVRLYVRSGAQPPDAARLLLDAFARFNIPAQAGITPSDAIPDPATTEIFVSHKP
jgi:hypothetical protein